MMRREPSWSGTPIGDSVERDMSRRLRRRRLIRRWRDALEQADIDAYFGPLHEPAPTDAWSAA